MSGRTRLLLLGRLVGPARAVPVPQAGTAERVWEPVRRVGRRLHRLRAGLAQLAGRRARRAEQRRPDAEEDARPLGDLRGAPLGTAAEGLAEAVEEARVGAAPERGRDAEHAVD